MHAYITSLMLEMIDGRFVASAIAYHYVPISLVIMYENSVPCRWIVEMVGLMCG